MSALQQAAVTLTKAHDHVSTALILTAELKSSIEDNLTGNADGYLKAVLGTLADGIEQQLRRAFE